MIINLGHPRRVFVFKLTFARIASFRTLPKTEVEIIKKHLLICLPTLPKRLCLVFSNSLNSLINRLEKGDLVEKDILVRNMVSNLEIDAQKRVIYRYKSPFNFIFEPEFSTGSPVGEPGGTRTHDTKLKRLVL